MHNIMVTGGCGFIGTNFIRYIFEDTSFDGRIINIDKLTYAGNPDNLMDIQKKAGPHYEFVRADICDGAVMADIFNQYQIDTLCHFAAESHVDRSIHEPADFIRTNIMGTFTLLELARQNLKKIKLFHHVSTDEVFGTLGPDGYFTESTPYDPSSPYSASKAGSDHLVRAYHRTYGLPVTISNCSNNYGPYQFPEKLIPLILLNALEEKNLPVYGDGRNVRDWLYVKDHCTAIWLIMQQGTRGETYNIGGHCELNNLEVVKMVCDLTDTLQPSLNASPRRDLITFVKDRPGHDFRYAIDFSKLQQELNWKPAESFASGLETTIKWYLNHITWVERIKSGAY